MKHVTYERLWGNNLRMTESWRPVDGWPGYMVSDHGRLMAVESEGNGAQKRMVGVARSYRCPDPRYYPAAELRSERRYTMVPIHLLVARAFLGPCPEGMECDHLNGDKNDARLVNLEYVTPRENVLRFWRRKKSLQARNGVVII